MTNRCIIIGASHAAATLAPSLRQEGWNGEILIISDDPHLPYHRPPLSKTFLAGGKTVDNLAIRPKAFYIKKDIKFQVGRVQSINRSKQIIYLDHDTQIGYDKLALCTGSRVRKLSIPGSDLSGIHYLRDIKDAQGIQQYTAKDKRAVIIGGGYIGLETASAMREMGMQVTLLEMESRILQRVTAPELSAFYSRVHTEQGVNIHTNIRVTHFVGHTDVQKVVCEDGTEFIADLVVVGVGVLPNIEMAEKAGILVDNGIIVDEYCATNDINIVAAGDCTQHFNKIYQSHIRLESVPNANEQGKVAAATICGNVKRYHSLPWFWSDQYDLKLQIAGLSQGYDQVLIRGDSHCGRSFAVFYLKKGRLIAVDCVNRPQEFMYSKKIITDDLDINPEWLIDESIAVRDLLTNL